MISLRTTLPFSPLGICGFRKKWMRTWQNRGALRERIYLHVGMVFVFPSSLIILSACTKFACRRSSIQNRRYAGLSHLLSYCLAPQKLIGTLLADCYTLRRTPITAAVFARLCRTRIFRATACLQSLRLTRIMQNIAAQEQHGRLFRTPMSSFIFFCVTRV